MKSELLRFQKNVKIGGLGRTNKTLLGNNTS